jgi:sugar O-acyltransferase (sialic acid O-acetyltransferase NeuD family)
VVNVVLVGYSGHAFVVADIIERNQYPVLGYYERSAKEKNPYCYDYLGSEANADIVKRHAVGQNKYALGIGDNFVRQKIDRLLMDFPWDALALRHPQAMLSVNCIIGAGTVVAAGAVINPLAKTGRGCIINTAAVVEHECQLGDFVHIAPAAVLAGNVTVGELSFIGANATIKQEVSIGSRVIVGAGSVVLRNIPDDQVWAGNPARRIR